MAVLAHHCPNIKVTVCQTHSNAPEPTFSAVGCACASLFSLGAVLRCGVVCCDDRSQTSTPSKSRSGTPRFCRCTASAQPQRSACLMCHLTPTFCCAVCVCVRSYEPGLDDVVKGVRDK
jgi:hypothetical protein